MTRVRTSLVACVAVLAAALAFAAPARADDARSVQVAGVDGRTVDFLVFLDPSVGADAQSQLTSSVVISGSEVPSTAKVVLDQPSAREVILVLDVSGSMRGDRIVAARKAAQDYVKALPPDVKVGLVTFNDTVQVGIAPTADRAAVSAAIQSVKAGQKTALYDGLMKGLDQVGTGGEGARVLILSDGGDTASAATLPDVTARVASAGVPVDVVALLPNVQHADILRSITAASGGDYLLATDAAGLETAFQAATRTFGGKVAVEAQVPDGMEASGKFAIVSVGIDGTEYRGTTQLPAVQSLEGSGAVVPAPVATLAPAVVPEVPVHEDDYSATLYAVLAALVVLVLGLTIAYYRRQQRAYMRTQQVLWYTTNAGTEGRPDQRPDFQQPGLMRSLDDLLARRKSYAATEAKLDNAEMNLTPAAWLVTRLGVTLAIVLVLVLLSGNLLVGLIVGGLIGWLGTRAVINSRENKRRKEFEGQLPDFLLLIASALRSGLSFTQALDSSAAEGRGQVPRQVRRALSETQMGSSIEASLTRVADRMQSDDLRWTVTALAIQREVGGNLSNILETAAQTVQGRAELRREVRTLSAEGRLSGWVLAALPVGLFLYMLVANRDYIAFFWSKTAGIVLLCFIGVIFAAGFLWMRKIVRIEV
jgi:tight adherence protein B